MKLKGILSTAIAILCGLIVLAGNFFHLTFLVNTSRTLVQWAILLSAFAVLLGIFNLFIVHLGKVKTRNKGTLYSILLLVAMLITFTIGVAAPYFPAAESIFDFTFRSVQLPVEASLGYPVQPP